MNPIESTFEYYYLRLVVQVGVVLNALSSCLGCTYGGARILHATSKDFDLVFSPHAGALFTFLVSVLRKCEGMNEMVVYYDW